MAYVPIRASASQPMSESITDGAVSGVNLLQAPEFQNSKFAQQLENYIPNAQGELEKRKGIELLESITGTDGIQAISRYDSDRIIYCYGTTCAVYKISTDTSTILKSNFTAGGQFELTRGYGDFMFVCNGKDKIWRIQKALSAEMVSNNSFTNYTVATDATGWSRNGGTIWSYNTSGYYTLATSSGDYELKGTLSTSITAGAYIITTNTTNLTGSIVFRVNNNLVSIDGTGVDKETYLSMTASSTLSITASNGGSGGVVLNSISIKKISDTLEIVELSNSPICKAISIYDNRLVAGNLVDIYNNEGTLRWAQKDTGDVYYPFETWSIPGTVLPTSPNEYKSRKVGPINSITTLGNQLVAFGDTGRFGIRIITNGDTGTALQYVVTDFEKEDYGGYRGAITTGKGIFFVNEGGIWNLLSGGATNQPYSEQEGVLSQLLGTAELESIDFSDADLHYDNLKDFLYVTCNKSSTKNNTIVWYNFKTKALGTITGWNVNRFLRIDDTIYAGWAGANKIYKLFTGTTDAGTAITATFKQEVPLAGVDTLHALTRTGIKGFFNTGSNLVISYDIYDKFGVLDEDYLTLPALTVGTAVNKEIRAASGSSIARCTRLVYNMTSTDSVAHKITWIKITTQMLEDNPTEQNLGQSGSTSTDNALLWNDGTYVGLNDGTLLLINNT